MDIHNEKTPIQNQINIEQFRVDGSLSQAQFDYLAASLNELNSDKAAQERTLRRHLELLDLKDTSIDKLKSEIERLNSRMRAILKNDDISDEIKSLIKQGDIDGAEALVDSYHDNQLKSQERAMAARCFEMGEVKLLKIKYQEAYEALKKAITYQPRNAKYLEEGATIAGIIGKYEEQLKWNEEALAIYQQAQSEPDVARLHNNLGSAWHSLGQYQKAIDYFELALNSDLTTYGENHPKVAIDRNNLGGAWDSLGLYQKAIDYYELALNSDLCTYGEDHPSVAIDRNSLGMAWKSLGRYQKAIDYHTLALNSDLITYGENHPKVATRHNNLGSAWKSLGEYQKAIDYYTLALNSDLITYGENHPMVATRHNNLGSAWDSLGQYQKAIDYFELALTTLRQTFPNGHQYIDITTESLAIAKKALSEETQNETK